MTDDRTVAPEDFHFEALYQGKEPLDGVEIGLDRPPWDLGEPQPVIVALEKAGALRSDILDAGCGLGDHAVFLAERGYRVTGFDAAPTAIAEARRRASARGVDVEVLLADATRLDGVEQRFATVLDSGLYHCLNDQQRIAYAAALHRVTMAGAELHLFCFSDTANPGIRMPNQVAREDLGHHLGRHWEIRGIEPSQFAVTFSREFLERASAENFPAFDIDLECLRVDESGRALVPMWRLHAIRRGLKDSGLPESRRQGAIQ